MWKVSILLVIVAWGARAYEVAYQTQVIEGPSQVIYEQQQPQVIYEQQPVYVQPAAVAQNCPIACPYGWNKWGPFTKNCYLMPSQPLHLDTFWNQYRHCQRLEPTSYPLVVNDLVEQALGTVVALQYAPSYALALSNAHLWLGGYVDYNGQWQVADGSRANGVLMITAKLSGERNGTCLSADPKTLGAWLTRPCKDDTGAVICEMAPRPVCDGRTGGMLPISPLQLNNIKDLIPKMPSLPILGQLFGGGSFLGLGGDGRA